MKNFPKTIYVTVIEDDGNIEEFLVATNKDFIKEEEEDVKVAVYQLVKVGVVVKSSKIVFE